MCAHREWNAGRSPGRSYSYRGTRRTAMKGGRRASSQRRREVEAGGIASAGPCGKSGEQVKCASGERWAFMLYSSHAVPEEVPCLGRTVRMAGAQHEANFASCELARSQRERSGECLHRFSCGRDWSINSLLDFGPPQTRMQNAASVAIKARSIGNVGPLSITDFDSESTQSHKPSSHVQDNSTESILGIPNCQA